MFNRDINLQLKHIDTYRATNRDPWHRCCVRYMYTTGLRMVTFAEEEQVYYLSDNYHTRRAIWMKYTRERYSFQRRIAETKIWWDLFYRDRGAAGILGTRNLATPPQKEYPSDWKHPANCADVCINMNTSPLQSIVVIISSKALILIIIVNNTLLMIKHTYSISLANTETGRRAL